MSSEMLKQSGGCDHLVQFYSSEAMLAETVGHYLAEGLRGDGTIVLIATASHRRTFATALAKEGFDLAELEASGRAVALDAAETLASFMRDGQPQWAGFEARIGPVLTRAGERGGVRGYGEMVDLLWQEGNLSAALRLEGFWNRLLQGKGIPLFCAYKADVFDCSGDPSLDVILNAHTHMVSQTLHGDVERSVERAMEEVFGAQKVAALRPLIRANQSRGAKLPWGEAAVLWLKNNLPEHAPRVVSRARAFLETSAAA